MELHGPTQALHGRKTRCASLSAELKTSCESPAQADALDGTAAVKGYANGHNTERWGAYANLINGLALSYHVMATSTLHAL